MDNSKVLFCVANNPRTHEVLDPIINPLLTDRVVSSRVQTNSIIEREEILCVVIDYGGFSWDVGALIDSLILKKISVIVLAERSNEESIVELMRRGVTDYLFKDNLNKERLEVSIRFAIDKSKLRQEILRKQKELEDFAYIASHDLNAPLYKIRQCCDLMKELCGEELSAQAKKLIDIIGRGCEQMNSLINDLLDYSRVDRETRIIEEIDLKSIVAEVIAIFRDQIDETNAVVKCGNLPKIKASRVAMRQIFQNLIGNALKYNKSTVPTIDIDFSGPVQQDRPTLILTFDDNGIGIDPKHYESIFKPFERLHTQGEFPGSGLGLAICKKLIEHQGGCIIVEPSSNLGGTRFKVELPNVK